MLVDAWLRRPNEGTRVREFEQNEGVGQLVVIATPLGNLGDISRRALHYLDVADVVYCEDTRHSNKLFSAHDIAVRSRLASLHEHNEASQCEQIIARIRAGETVVIISDAGTPGISDPGTRVIAAVADAGLKVTTVPGPSAVIAALTLSGLDTERFIMEGFVPRKHGEREVLYANWAKQERTIVFFESPQRLATTLSELAQLFGQRRVAVAREMTKLHEEVLRGTVAEVSSIVNARDIVGEVVVVLEGATNIVEADDATIRAALLERLGAGSSVRDAAAFVADTLGASRRVTYEIALALRVEPTP